jgi:NTP pyrophosphatase (non-canonical NTP hydrolase)
MDLQKRVGEWADAAFPRSTIGTMLRHLKAEIQELDEATDAMSDRYIAGMKAAIARDEDPATVMLQTTHTAEEAADVLLILLHIAHRSGFDLLAAAEAKFAECQKRTWERDEKRGYDRHVVTPE